MAQPARRRYSSLSHLPGDRLAIKSRRLRVALVSRNAIVKNRKSRGQAVWHSAVGNTPLRSRKLLGGK